MVSDTSLHSEVRVSPHADPAEMSSKQLLRPVWFEHSYGMGHRVVFSCRTSQWLQALLMVTA